MLQILKLEMVLFPCRKDLYKTDTDILFVRKGNHGTLAYDLGTDSNLRLILMWTSGMNCDKEQPVKTIICRCQHIFITQPFPNSLPRILPSSVCPVIPADYFFLCHQPLLSHPCSLPHNRITAASAGNFGFVCLYSLSLWHLKCDVPKDSHVRLLVCYGSVGCFYWSTFYCCCCCCC